MKQIFILILAVAVFTSCQKNFSTEQPFTTNPPATSLLTDTSRIVTVVEYQYTNGVVTDSIIRVLRNATLNGQKKIRLTEVFASSPADTSVTIYNYNTENKLIEIKATYNASGSDFERTRITWNADNISRMQYDSSGSIKETDDFTYTPSGSTTRISVNQIPHNSNLDTSFYPNGGIQWFFFTRSELYVDQNFRPLYTQTYQHSYIDNYNNSSFAQNSWDTIKVNFGFSGNNLITENYLQARHDTNLSVTPGINFSTVNLLNTYTRSSTDNLAFTNILRNLYGDKLFTLMNHYYAWTVDWILPEDFGGFTYYNQSLLNESQSQTATLNGLPDPSGTFNTGVVDRYAHNFDSQNRVIKSVRYATYQPGNLINSGIRIIYP